MAQVHRAFYAVVSCLVNKDRTKKRIFERTLGCRENNNFALLIRGSWPRRSDQQGDCRDASASTRHIARRHAVHKQGRHGEVDRLATTMALEDFRDILWLKNLWITR